MIVCDLLHRVLLNSTPTTFAEHQGTTLLGLEETLRSF